MARTSLMSGFPASPEAQVTLANWFYRPYNEWAFRNVRQVVPTAEIRRSSRPSKLAFLLRSFSDVELEGLDGNRTTLRNAVRELDVDGILVMHRGVVVWELYEHGFAPQMQHILFSVTKSFAGTLVGILADIGKIDPDEPIVKYLPEASKSAYGSARIRHLLDMNVAVSFDEDYLATDGDLLRYRRSAGWSVNDRGGLPSPGLRDFLLSLKPSGKPHGEVFHYVSPNSDVLGWVIERVSGKPFAEVMREHIWEPLGTEEDAYIGVDAYGFGRAGGGLCVSLRDLARFGEMMRNNGLAGNRQVVPRWWIDDILHNGCAEAWQRGDLTELFPSGNYRSHWFTSSVGRSVLCGLGLYGQCIYIDQQDEMVIARFSSQAAGFDVPRTQMWLRACRSIGNTLNSRIESLL